MNNTDQGRSPAVQPVDPAMQSADQVTFAPLTTDENEVLRAHLTSGWRKQAAVYPTLSEPWKETGILLNDLYAMYEAAIEDQYGPADAVMTEPQATGPEPEPEVEA
jgi:hypothetical protein